MEKKNSPRFVFMEMVAILDSMALAMILLLLPWLVPSSGVAGIADDLIPPCCPVCRVVLFQTGTGHDTYNFKTASSNLVNICTHRRQVSVLNNTF